jgi:hypothetical protein
MKKAWSGSEPTSRCSAPICASTRHSPNAETSFNGTLALNDSGNLPGRRSSLVARSGAVNLPVLMSTHGLVRAGAAAAITAGMLRAAASFIGNVGSETERQTLYFVIDFFLLLSLIAAFAQNHRLVGRWGAGGFFAAVAGILLVRSSRAVPGVDLYPAGALTVAIGCVMLSAVWWRRANGSPVVPLLFAVSVATGLAGQAAGRAELFVASGVIFGAAMIGVGRQILVTMSSRDEQAAIDRRTGGQENQRT